MWPPPLPEIPIMKLQRSSVQDLLIQTFRNKSQDHPLALGRNQAEQFMFEY